MSLAEPTSGDRAVGFLDFSDLECCDTAMTIATQWHTKIGGDHEAVRSTHGYLCLKCKRFVTQIAFLQNHHGTREARRARLREMNYA